MIKYGFSFIPIIKGNLSGAAYTWNFGCDIYYFSISQCVAWVPNFPAQCIVNKCKPTLHETQKVWLKRSFCLGMKQSVSKSEVIILGFSPLLEYLYNFSLFLWVIERWWNLYLTFSEHLHLLIPKAKVH